LYKSNAKGGLSTEKHLGHLDSLRGFAILGVLLVHVAVLTQQRGNPAGVVGGSGQRGVQFLHYQRVHFVDVA
jgi:peptidoglycan/LPS O-acetylase OafA/YrhL